MAITIVTRAGKGSPLNATEHDDNLLNIVAGIENTSTGHDHDGTDSKKVIAGNVTNTPAGNIAATDVQSALNELDTEKLAKASNLSDVANAATAFGNIKQSATTSATGVSELATTDETITGTDTARTTTPAGVAGAMAVQTNPLAKSQGVHMTYAASGSTGITVADNDNIDFGTGDFTLVWRGSLPDWDTATEQRLINKYHGGTTTGWQYYITSGTISVYLRNAGTSIIKNSSSALTLTDNTEHELTAVVVRETASVDGSITFYVDGKIFGSAQAITAASPIDLDNAAALYVMGWSGVRNNSINKSAYLYNRALSASEVLDLYRNGIAFADKWGSQTELITTQNNRDFSGGTIGDWTKLTTGSGTLAYNTDAIGGADNKQGLLTSAGDDYLYAYLLNTKFPTIEQGKRYTFEFNAYVPAGNTNKSVRIGFQDADVTFTDFTFTLSGDTWTKVKSEFVANAPMSGISAIRLGFYNTSANGDKIYFDDISIVKVGATLALEPEGIQQGRWLDSSSNHLNATWPTSGASLIRPISNQPVLTNLLSNSGFGVWSNGTLENVGSNLITGWTNHASYQYATFTTSGADITSAVVTAGVGVYYGYSNNLGLTSGNLYKIVATLTLNSGQAPTLQLGTGGEPSTSIGALSAGVNTFVIEATTSTYLWLYNTNDTNFSCTFTLYEVTPGCVAADYLAMDGWGRTGSVAVPSVWRQHKDSTYTKVGSFYSAKITNPVQDDASLYYPITGIGDNVEWREKFAGRTVTFGAWVWSASAAKLCISETDQYIDNNAIATATYSAGSAWEWKEVTATFSATPAKAHFFLWLPTGATAYFSQPMLVYGSSIGEGNYQPIVNEVVDLEAYVRIDPGTVTSTTLFNLEAKTNGKLPKGLKAIYSLIVGKNTAANKVFGMYGTATVFSSTFQNTQVANQEIYVNGRTLCDANGDVTLYVADGNFTLQNWDIHSVQVN